MLEWGDLRYFLAISRGRTLAAAARELGVEATTVGRRIVAFERTLGARLFDRRPDGFALTRAGERILENARAVEAQMMEVERKAVGEDTRLDGTVRLATTENLAVGILVRLLAPLSEAHPALAIELLTGAQAVDLRRREADLAVRVGPGMKPSQHELVARKLVTIGMALYASESYVARFGAPREGASLEGHRLVGYGGDLRAIPTSQALGRIGAGARTVLRANSMLTVTEACAAGMGITVLPCFLGDSEPGLLRLWPEPVTGADVWVVVHPDLQRTARVRLVIDFLTAAITARAAELRGNQPRAGGGDEPPRRRAKAVRNAEARRRRGLA
jgi:DNA-binding transcriptional LysR family regulator